VRFILLTSALLMACPVKKDIEQNMYSRPILDFPEDDEDIDDLPEAGESQGEEEDESNKETTTEDSSD
jgi:hypothetical protein